MPKNSLANLFYETVAGINLVETRKHVLADAGMNDKRRRRRRRKELSCTEEALASPRKALFRELKKLVPKMLRNRCCHEHDYTASRKEGRQISKDVCARPGGHCRVWKPHIGH